ncbi:hypothetical protein [Actinoplanes derwentensis]|uniref:Guanylate cyclase domain-containing protein n=1 Tax=Actinoplanes derwentensis TaxID=113562 RepID=A0A1H2AW94_9ACTN|nr:hypothetical protein [Actinoplanes derwentensis]GID87284.1 hypothetical protein Ade03nite_62080 [Actinoplanes derwentensis]SDT50183.1 hypothetical protein SAMN04489716_4143 [Actinoplanes derwentensis]
MAQRPFSSLIVFLDIAEFGKRPDSVAAELRESLYKMVGTAISESGLTADEPAIEDRGDGMLILLPRTGPIEVLGRFLHELETEVGHRAKSRTPEYRMRLRIAVNSGFVWHDGNGWIGAAINHAARLVDSTAVRAVLGDHPAAHIAVIVSDDLHHGVIAQGHAALDAGAYRECRVIDKEVDARAWIRIPTAPAGSPPPAPDTGGPDDRAGHREPEAPASGIGSVRAQNIGNVFGGPVRARDIIGTQNRTAAPRPERTDR